MLMGRQICAFMSLVGVICFLVGTGCTASGDSETAKAKPPLMHDAYLWQVAWTGPVKESVATLPSAIDGLRVLTLEIRPGEAWIWPKVDLETLAQSKREITAVVRIGGSRPLVDFSLELLLDKLGQWREHGIALRGIEIDHDCATAGLQEYVDWLHRERAIIGDLHLSITALPTWMESEALVKLVGVVDEVVLQLHAIREPVIFESVQALAWTERFSQLFPTSAFRVALPTYKVMLNGRTVGVGAREMQSFGTRLQEAQIPSLRGVVWFRMPVAGDEMAFSAQTLSAVIENHVLRSDIQVQLRATSPQLYDLVVDNYGALSGKLPTIEIQGIVEAIDLSAAYKRHQGLWESQTRLRAGKRRVVGWVRGDNLSLKRTR